LGIACDRQHLKMMLGTNEKIGPEEPRVIVGHSLESVDKGSALDTVKDIGVLGAHLSVILRGRITRPTQDIGETMWRWSARRSRDRLDLMIKRTQIIVMGWSRVGDVKIDTWGSITSISVSSVSDTNASTSSGSWCTQEVPDDAK
jgi:hypothetical protein